MKITDAGIWHAKEVERGRLQVDNELVISDVVYGEKFRAELLLQVDSWTEKGRYLETVQYVNPCERERFGRYVEIAGQTILESGTASISLDLPAYTYKHCINAGFITPKMVDDKKTSHGDGARVDGLTIWVKAWPNEPEPPAPFKLTVYGDETGHPILPGLPGLANAECDIVWERYRHEDPLTRLSRCGIRYAATKHPSNPYIGPQIAKARILADGSGLRVSVQGLGLREGYYLDIEAETLSGRVLRDVIVLSGKK